MNVLSLFNGMGFGAMALETLGVKVDNYYSSEIDKFANKAANALFPSTIQIGDVTKWREWDIDLGDIDLLMAGFPCQAWSMAGKQEGDDDPRGALVHDLIDIWKSINISREAYGNLPVKFMFENVRMKKKFLDYINNLFGVEPICINSALVSAQNRVRYYWTNIDINGQPSDRGIILDHILETGEMRPNTDGWQKWWKENKEFQVKKKYSAVCNDGSTDKAICMTARQYASWNGNFAIIQTPRGNNPGGIRAENGKTPCLSSSSWQHNNHLIGSVKSGARRSRGDEVRTDNKANCLLSTGHQSRWLVSDDVFYRKLTVRECSRLQTIPEYQIDKLLESGVTDSQLYKMLGNGWTHDVITHIFKGLLVDSAPITKRRMFKQMELC